MVDVEEGASVLTLRSFGLAGEEKRKKEEKNSTKVFVEILGTYLPV